MIPLSKYVRTVLKGSLKPAVAALAPRRVDLPERCWGLQRDASGRLARAGLPLSELVARFGSPLFVIDAQRLDANAAAFLSVPVQAAAGLECYYSYKTNPVPHVLARLHARGVGAEVISEYELWLAQKLGVAGDRIVLNGPGRSRRALEIATEIGALVQVNHREEIPALAQIARSLGKRCRVGLRIAPAGGWGGQFGEPVAKALAAYREIEALRELDIVALHVHLGAELSSATAVRSLVREVMDFDARLRAELAITVEIIDFGGSLACPTVSHYGERELRLNRALGVDLRPRPPETVLRIEEYVRVIVSEVEARCAREQRPRPRLFCEPGRSLTSDTQLLLCRVTGLKASGAGGPTHAILDAGINIAEPLRSEYHQIFTADPPRSHERRYRLVGPICTPMDTLAWSLRFPELAPGDVLAIMDAGAYFVPFATSFSFPQPAIVMLDGDRVSLVRRAETFEDLVRRDIPDAQGLFE
jgi:diaminopimelate decarboxylase